MKREKVIELVKAAGNEGNFACGTIIINGRDSDDWVMQFARLVEIETLERVKDKVQLAKSAINHVTTSEWGEGWVCGAQDALDGLLVFIRNLKETHDKE